MVVLLFFWWTSVVFHSRCTNLHSTYSAQDSLFVTFWHLSFHVLLMVAILTGVRWCLIVGLIGIFLMLSGFERLSIHLLAIPMSSLEKLSLGLAIFQFCGIFWFCCWVLCMSSLYFSVLAPYQIYDLQLFSPSEFFFVVFFLCISLLVGCSLTYWFPCLFLLLVSDSENHQPDLASSLPPMFSSRDFTVSDCYVQVFNPFWVNFFVSSVRWWSSSILLHEAVSFPLIRDLPFPIVYCWLLCFNLTNHSV